MRLLLALGALCALCIGGCLVYGLWVAYSASNGDSAASAPAEAPAAGSTTPGSAGPTRASTPFSGFDAYQGEWIRLGEFSYSLTDYETEKSIGDRFFKESAPDGARFLIVRFAERNEGSETATVSTTANAELFDAEGRSFRPSSRGMTAIAMKERSHDLILSERQPGVTVNAAVVFEVPESVLERPHKLVFQLTERGALGSATRRIALLNRKRSQREALLDVMKRELAPVFSGMALVVSESESREGFDLVRSVMLPEDALDDAAISAMASNFARSHRIETEHDGKGTVEHGEVTTSGELISYSDRLYRGKGRERTLVLAHTWTLRFRNGRYTLVSWQVEFAEDDRNSESAQREGSK